MWTHRHSICMTTTLWMVWIHKSWVTDHSPSVAQKCSQYINTRQTQECKNLQDFQWLQRNTHASSNSSTLVMSILTLRWISFFSHRAVLGIWTGVCPLCSLFSFKVACEWLRPSESPRRLTWGFLLLKSQGAQTQLDLPDVTGRAPAWLGSSALSQVILLEVVWRTGLLR